jgi:hypothetical protein
MMLSLSGAWMQELRRGESETGRWQKGSVYLTGSGFFSYIHITEAKHQAQEISD